MSLEGPAPPPGLTAPAAAQGEAGAHFHLGRLYEAGRAGLPRDPARALELYSAAAAGGFEPARSILSAGGLLGH